jgi:hypothetical protein
MEREVKRPPACPWERLRFSQLRGEVGRKQFERKN